MHYGHTGTLSSDVLPSLAQTLAETVGVTHILNLQTDKDMQHWSVDIREIERRSRELGVTHMRRSVGRDEGAGSYTLNDR